MMVRVMGGSMITVIALVAMASEAFYRYYIGYICFTFEDVSFYAYLSHYASFESLNSD